MDKVEKPRYPEGHTQSSEPFTIYMKFRVQAQVYKYEHFFVSVIILFMLGGAVTCSMYAVIRIAMSGLINKHTSKVLTNSLFVQAHSSQLVMNLFAMGYVPYSLSVL